MTRESALPKPKAQPIASTVPPVEQAGKNTPEKANTTQPKQPINLDSDDEKEEDRPHSPARKKQKKVDKTPIEID